LNVVFCLTSYVLIPFSIELSCKKPITPAPMTPADIIPKPAITFSVSAPPLGNRSATTPSMVGQKKLLPNPYMVAATNIMIPADCDKKYKPMAATAEHTANKPNGDILCTMGPAKKRNTNMMAEVYTSTHPA